VRTVRLLQVAAEAEILRLRYLMRRHGRRAAFGVLAAIFALSVLVILDVTGWQLLRLYVAAIYATLLLLGINLVIALVFGALAARSSVSSHEREALRIRQQALQEARGSLALAALVPITRSVLAGNRQRGARRWPFGRRQRA
jgi:TRAP-type mannitol/chloroaromatic compound transport system permease large subunit